MIELSIPAIPLSLNIMLRRHWSERAKSQKLWDRWIWAALHSQPSAVGVYPLRTKTRVTIDRRSSGKGLDPDGLVGSIKPVLDALVHCSVLLDDSPAYVELKVTQSRSAHVRTLIQLEPV